MQDLIIDGHDYKQLKTDLETIIHLLNRMYISGAPTHINITKEIKLYSDEWRRISNIKR